MARSRLHIYRKVTLPLPCKPAAELRGRNEGNRTFGYIGTREKCGPCKQRSHDRAISLSCCSVEIAQFLFQKG